MAGTSVSVPPAHWANLSSHHLLSRDCDPRWAVGLLWRWPRGVGNSDAHLRWPGLSLAPGAEVLTLPSLLAGLLHLSFKIYFHFFLPIHTPTTPNTTALASWLFPFLTNDLSTVTVAPLCWYLLKLDLESKCGFMERWVRHFFFEQPVWSTATPNHLSVPSPL